MNKFYFLLLSLALYALPAGAQEGATITYEDNFGTDMLSYAGLVNEKNSYTETTSGFEVTVQWSGERWEIVCCASQNAGEAILQFFSEVPTTPNPPDLATGNWQAAVESQALLQFSGSGTQAAPEVTFTAPGDLCLDSGVQTGLSGGTPAGGVYSGTGVTDAGDGTAYTFDPAAAGLGVHTITYTVDGFSTADSVEVFTAPMVDLGPDIETYRTDTCITYQPQVMGGSGNFTYGWAIESENMEDISFATQSVTICPFDTSFATLFVTDQQTGCSTQDRVNFFVNDPVFTAPDGLCLDAGVQSGLSGGRPTGGVYSGPGVTDAGDGATYSFDPVAAGVGIHTVTYAVQGQTLTDDIEVFALPDVSLTLGLEGITVASGPQPLTGGAPAGGVYTGPGVTNGSFDPGVAGVGTHTITYLYTDANGCTVAETTQVSVEEQSTSITTIGQTGIRLYPNPTSGVLRLENAQAEQVDVFDNTGRLVLRSEQPGPRLDISRLPAGIYVLRINVDGEMVSARVVKR